jgi:hypothetical protein
LTIKEFVERVRKADLVVGIPSYNNASTIGYVVKQVAKGLVEFFPKQKGVIIVSDGGSKDDTREVANSVEIPDKVERLVTVYSGISGKGSAIKLIFELAKQLDCIGVAMVDSDLRSITPEWIELLLSPLIEGIGFVAPRYVRFKYDGTITNQVTYPFTQALYGVKIRQPIGGDFGLSKKLVDIMLESPLWKTSYTPRFGIDISITHTALAHNLSVVETLLGVKVHDVKDPAKHLAPMFRQVVGALFTCMNLYYNRWREVATIKEVKLVKGKIKFGEPEPFYVDYKSAFKVFEEGFQQQLSIIKSILPNELLKALKRSVKDKVALTANEWAMISFHFASAFNFKNEIEKESVLEAYRICWIGKVAHFVKDTIDLSNDEAEARISSEAEVFMKEKPYLLTIWGK